ncbi:MAG: transcriptional regulator [Planctomycetota bacterium]|nr:MAG: transcriptional regulator [Planctomycetota bacterium]
MGRLGTLAELQEAVGAWLREHPDGLWPPLANLARLAEEVGELARLLNQRYGPKRRKPGELPPAPQRIADELADVVLVALVLACSEGIELEDALGRALERARRRSGPAEPLTDAGRAPP